MEDGWRRWVVQQTINWKKKQLWLAEERENWREEEKSIETLMMGDKIKVQLWVDQHNWAIN